jgi:hypothetical protein
MRTLDWDYREQVDVAARFGDLDNRRKSCQAAANHNDSG